jgi:hypothetical protein
MDHSKPDVALAEQTLREPPIQNPEQKKEEGA